MKVLFLEYPKCSTCQKAKKWLQENEIAFEDRHIVEKNPTADEIDQWQKRSGLPLKRFFNTSGLVYKDLGLKDKLGDMEREEQLKLLSENGMLVKRPIIVTDQLVLVGFRPEEWKQLTEL